MSHASAPFCQRPKTRQTVLTNTYIYMPLASLFSPFLALIRTDSMILIFTSLYDSILYWNFFSSLSVSYLFLSIRRPLKPLVLFYTQKKKKKILPLNDVYCLTICTACHAFVHIYLCMYYTCTYMHPAFCPLCHFRDFGVHQ